MKKIFSSLFALALLLGAVLAESVKNSKKQSITQSVSAADVKVFVAEIVGRTGVERQPNLPITASFHAFEAKTIKPEHRRKLSKPPFLSYLSWQHSYFERGTWLILLC
ncbi:MAG TPA: hypothetical protein VNI84_18980 [Pyrinomonadaceae bacterium]|nr:hypothetical protein [Pyrinomonadaceae bacterium]